MGVATTAKRARCASTVTASAWAATCSGWSPRSIFEVQLPSPFITTLGSKLNGVRILVESHGDPSLPPSRTVLVLPSFSHSSHVASNGDDQSPGWWQDMVGPGKPIDTRSWRVLCPSVLGSPFCPTRPATPDADTGKPLRSRFPQLTPTDLARAHRATLEVMGVAGSGIPALHAVVGASLGGMQAVQYASLYGGGNGGVKRLVAVAATGRTTPYTVCIRRQQRRAILADPGYAGGEYGAAGSGDGPWEGLRQARELGTLFYRSRGEFDSRFNWEPTGDRHFTALDT